MSICYLCTPLKLSMNIQYCLYRDITDLNIDFWSGPKVENLKLDAIITIFSSCESKTAKFNSEEPLFNILQLVISNVSTFCGSSLDK